MVMVDTELGEGGVGGGEAGDFEGDGRGWRGQVFVVVVPEEDVERVRAADGDAVYVGRGAGGVGDELIEPDGAGAGELDLVAVEHGEEAEDVEDGLVDAVGGELAEAGEGGLVFELEGPGDGTLEVNVVEAGEFGGTGEHFGYADAVEGAVAVAVLRTLAGGAAFGV